jgi:hypothetical protein
MAAAIVDLLVDLLISVAVSMVMNLLFKHTPQSQSPTYSANLGTAIDNTLPIPLIYGTVKVAGNMLWSEMSSDQTWLYKIVSFGDGQIQGISDIRLNDIPISGDVTCLLIWNNIFEDAKVSVNGNYIYLWADGGNLQTTINGSNSYDLVGSQIVSTGEGWTADIPGNTYDAGTLDNLAWTPCYSAPVSLTLTNASVNIQNSWANWYPGDGIQFVDPIVLGIDTGINSATSLYSTLGWTPTTQQQINSIEIVGSLKYDAYVTIGAQATSQLNGDYNVTAIVTGRLVRVYSTPTTYTVQYSNNPAWCILDFLICYNGIGLDVSQIDIQSFINAAEYCDELITNQDGTKQKRFTLNYILDEKKSHLDWLVDMMRTCSAYPTYQNGIYGMMVEQPGSVEQVFDETCMNELSIWWSPLEEIPDIVHIVYVEPAYEYAKIAAQARMQSYIRKSPFTKEVDIYGITNFSQASRLAWFYLNQATTTTMWCKFKTDRRGIMRTIGDIIALNDYVMNFTGKQFRIMQMSEAEDDAIEITCREYNSELYNDNFGSVAPVVNFTTLPNPLSPPPAPTITGTSQVYYVCYDKSIVSTLTINITSPPYMFFKNYAIYYSIDGGITWLYSGTTPANSYIIGNVTPGETYSVKVLVENINNVLSESSNIYSTLITGQVIPPAQPLNFSAEETVGGILLTWGANTEPDINRYQIYQGTSVSQPFYVSSTVATSYFYPTSVTGTFNFFLVAVDNSGNSSLAANTSCVTVPPSQVQGFFVTQSNLSLVFYWEQNVGEIVSYEIRAGSSWDRGTVIGEAMGGNTTIYYAPSGSQNFWIKAKDIYGYYCLTPTWATLAVAPAINRTIVLTLDAVANSWEGINVVSGALHQTASTMYGCSIVSGGLQLNQGAVYGECSIPINLGASYSARNWINSSFSSVIGSGSGITWGSSNFNWDSPQATAAWFPSGNDDLNISVISEIAYYTGLNSNVIEDFTMKDSTTGNLGTNATTSVGVTYSLGRYYDGIYIGDGTTLDYNDVTIPAEFSLSFTLTLTTGFMGDSCLLSLVGATNWIQLIYSKVNNNFYLQSSDGTKLTISPTFLTNDYITFGISQTATTRRFMAFPVSSNQLFETDGQYAPLGVFTSLALYAKI